MSTLGTIKAHGFKIGDMFNFHGMASDPIPTAEGTLVQLSKVGNKYMLTTVHGEIMTWEFGATAKIWVSLDDFTAQDEVAENFTCGERLIVEIDGLPTGEYQYVSTGAAFVYLHDADSAQCAIDANKFLAAWKSGNVHKFIVTQEALPSGHVFYATCSHGYTTGFHNTADDARDVAIGHGTVSRPLHSAWPVDTRVTVKGESATVVKVRGVDVMVKLDTPDRRDGSHIVVPASSLVIAEDVPAPFRTNGKVKNTARARRFRKGA